MAGVQHFSPGVFNGSPDKCGLNFFDNFELVAQASGWGNSTKLIYFPLYLNGSAFKLFKIIKSVVDFRLRRWRIK